MRWLKPLGESSDSTGLREGIRFPSWFSGGRCVHAAHLAEEPGRTRQAQVRAALAWPERHQLPLLSLPGSSPPSTLMPAPRECCLCHIADLGSGLTAPLEGRWLGLALIKKGLFLDRLWNSQPFPSVFLVPGMGMRHTKRGQGRASKETVPCGKGRGRGNRDTSIVLPETGEG